MTVVALGTLAALWAGGSVVEAGQGTTTQQGTPPTISAGGRTDWSSHNLDLYNSRYAELDQINTDNADRLRSTWSFDVPAGVDVSQVTPLVVDGMMYFHAANMVFGINAATGESVWTLELDVAERNRVRGPTYADGKIYSYNGANLVAADAKTG